MGNMCSSLTEEERLAESNIAAKRAEEERLPDALQDMVEERLAAGKSAEEERLPDAPQTRAADPPIALDALREAMGPDVFERVFADDQLKRYEKGEKHFFVSVSRGGARYDEKGKGAFSKNEDGYDNSVDEATLKAWEERAQEVHAKLQFFGMHSFVVPLRQEEGDAKAGASVPDDGGRAALIQFGLENARAMVLLGDRDYGALTEPANESTFHQLEFAMGHEIPVIPVDLCMALDHDVQAMRSYWPPLSRAPTPSSTRPEFEDEEGVAERQIRDLFGKGRFESEKEGKHPEWGFPKYTEFVPDLKPLVGLAGKDKYGDPTWNPLALAESVATKLPRDLNFDGDVREKPDAKYCVVTFPGDYSGDFGRFLDSNDRTTCCACVFQADGATSQFLGPAMVSVKGKHAGEHWPIVGHPKGKSCRKTCWCTELEGAGTVDEQGQQVGVELLDKMGGRFEKKGDGRS